MVQVRQIKDLEIHPTRPDGGERLNLDDDFIDRAREAVRSKLAHLATDARCSSPDLGFVLAHAQNLGGRKDERFASAPSVLTRRSHTIELSGRIVQG